MRAGRIIAFHNGCCLHHLRISVHPGLLSVLKAPQGWIFIGLIGMVDRIRADLCWDQALSRLKRQETRSSTCRLICRVM